jgi:hypothetical protein
MTDFGTSVLFSWTVLEVHPEKSAKPKVIIKKGKDLRSISLIELIIFFKNIEILFKKNYKIGKNQIFLWEQNSR